MNKRTIVYIDGFNFYFGLKDKGWKQYYWVNLYKMSNKLLKSDQNLVKVKYFTSKIKYPVDKKQRQSQYLHALRMTSGIEIMYGKYENDPVVCDRCGNVIQVKKEKMTDVQLGTQLVKDAYSNNFDVALVVTGDRDIVPAVEVVKTEMPLKRIVAVFPPMRSCVDLRSVCDAYIHITETVLKSSLFDDNMSDKVGNTVTKPKEWV